MTIRSLIAISRSECVFVSLLFANCICANAKKAKQTTVRYFEVFDLESHKVEMSVDLFGGIRVIYNYNDIRLIRNIDFF